jgi:hypothetical protein
MEEEAKERRERGLCLGVEKRRRFRTGMAIEHSTQREREREREIAYPSRSERHVVLRRKTGPDWAVNISVVFTNFSKLF